MSTLAAARADNFYVSKNFNPANELPKKVQTKPFVVVQGQKVGGSKVRYQTPFHVRCQGCQNMVAKGVRFNSMKTWVGNFHSTQIYQFRMKCPQCVQKFVVRTDPQNCDYLYVSGARRIFQTKDCTDEQRIRDQSIQKKIREDPFYKLQNQQKDKETYGKVGENIQKIIDNQKIRAHSDIDLNRLLRKKIRNLKQQQNHHQVYKRQKNLFISLADQQPQDQKDAQQIKFKKNKMIKKQQKSHQSQRQKLKMKLQKLKPNFRKQLQKQIINENKVRPSIFAKK